MRRPASNPLRGRFVHHLRNLCPISQSSYGGFELEAVLISAGFPYSYPASPSGGIFRAPIDAYCLQQGGRPRLVRHRAVAPRFPIQTRRGSANRAWRAARRLPSTPKKGFLRPNLLPMNGRIQQQAERTPDASNVAGGKWAVVQTPVGEISSTTRTIPNIRGYSKCYISANDGLTNTDRIYSIS